MTARQVRMIRERRANGDGYKAIATALGLSRDTVRYYCRNSSTGVSEETQIGDGCPQCRSTLPQPGSGRKRKFCGEPCRRSWWAAHPSSGQPKADAIYELTCVGCGKAFTAYGNKHRRYCSHTCYVANRYKS